ncbi:hypothetical protein SAMN04487936_101446 [Halobacillus dabanensis]|uniref:Uncharacterized protein n=1 Tax=Halobacillus dabanensis TaxID=240302 RepID=A0A1I3PW29_HALDA|nr:hypothetical protein [Halobacillus dabanensis]SFJ25136.1 hypothetical protein SAMN04487936_101446 [Halobacillus dabanensis]
MKGWRRSKRKIFKHQSRREEKYKFFDLVIEILFWIPEILIFPFRLLFWMLRGIGRIIGHILDSI